MLVLTLALAALGFALLVIALMTGDVIWAWGCIVACGIGALVLMASALSVRGKPVVEADEAATRRHGKSLDG